MKKLLIALIVGIIITVIGGGTPALAHHTTITCSNRDTSEWSIVNSENKTMTYTTNHGHSGSIGKRGTAKVTWAGDELTVYGVWSNGNTNTSKGEGKCTPVETTTTTSTTTTEATTTTTADTTSSTTTTSNPATTTTVGDTTSTSSPTTTSPPETTRVTTPGTTPVTAMRSECWLTDQGDTPYQGEWILLEGNDPNVVGTHSISGIPCGPTSSATTPPTSAGPPSTPTLPATGSSTTAAYTALLAVLTLLGGLGVTRLARRP